MIMSTAEKNSYYNADAIGYYCTCNFGGLEILGIEYGITDAIIVCDNYGDGRRNIRRHAIKETPSGRLYFNRFGTRYYLDNIMRA